MKRLMYLMFAVALVSCANGGNKNETKSESTTDAVVEISVDEIVDNGTNYVGKTVKFSGLVNHVCRHSGTKLTVEGSKPETYLKVMATDEVKSFDPELTGARVEVIGEVIAIDPQNVEECSSIENVKVDSIGKVFVVNCKKVAKL